MEIPALLTAFVFGFGASRTGLAPLVGYLTAGYVLSLLGFESSQLLDGVADLGILLLLFAIGLKLRPRTFTHAYVWGTAAVFAVVGTLLPLAAVLSIRATGSNIASLDLRSALIIGLALSFSSTVFAVKALEQTNETESVGGRIAIGILILQDLLAVILLAMFSDTRPSWFALLVIPGFFVARPIFEWVLDRTGHGELLVLLGFTLAVGVGAASFELVGLKADLGALTAGLALASHPRAVEMSERLLGIKDLLLVGFFLSVGLTGVPTPEALVVALIVVLLLPTRSFALLWLLTRYRLRGRTALHTSLTLSAYSEFGLVVTVSAVASGALAESWVQTMGVAVAASFIAASAANKLRYRLYDQWYPRLKPLERHPITAEDAVLDFEWARIVVFGMGRVGTGAYDELVKHRQGRVLGVDREAELVSKHDAAGRVVIRGDAVDRGFWERARLHPEIELVVAAMNSHEANLECVRRIREFLPTASIAAVAVFRDQVADLHEAGVDVARNLYEEAGQALADDAVTLLMSDDSPGP